MGVDKINGTDGLDTALELPQSVDSILYGRGHWQGQEFLGHTAGSSLFLMLEQFDAILLVFRLHLHQNLLATLFRKVREQIGSRVGIHLLDDVGGTARVE